MMTQSVDVLATTADYKGSSSCRNINNLSQNKRLCFDEFLYIGNLLKTAYR